MKKYYFVSGMPRSGSTLLCNILAQNPNFHATHTSGCLDVLFGIRNNWHKLVEHQAHPNQEALDRVLKATLHAYYADIEKSVIFDKSRGWLAYIEILQQILNEPPKILVPIRLLPDILASFEKLYRETAKVKQPPGEAENYFAFQSVEGRCHFWMQPNSPVGLALNRLRDALKRGFSKNLHFIEFEELTNNPAKKLKDIYDFLGEPHFEHNFDHVEQVTFEDDSVHGFVNLHNIRNKVEPVKSQAVEIIGNELVAKFAGAY